ncbi:MAG: NAD-dependent succinate-semialdehyde dehydrogenase [Actinomycetota bacterium]
MTEHAQIIEAASDGLLIAGVRRPSSDGGHIDVINPASEDVIASVPDATPHDGREALDAAVAAQDGWASTAPRDRGEILRAAFEKITHRIDDLALLMTLEMGKPLADSRAEIAYGAEFFRWFSEEAVRISGRWSTSPGGQTRLLTMQQPVGPCLMITPWNFPLAMGTRKIGPAIAAGCTMVVKPASQTPLTMYALAHLLDECGLPSGVLNVITTSRTSEVVSAMVTDPRLRKLTFTGSTPVGRRLIEQSAQGVLRVSMELGGNAPFLVFADADVDAAVAGAMLAKMRNNGEACTAANRFIVHEAVAEKFTEQLTRRMSALVVGPGIDAGVQVGPLIDAIQRDSVAALVDQAVEVGARVMTGGKRSVGKGFFYPPTVLASVPPSATLLQEEIFGPVAPITTFSDDDDALAMANDTQYGLVAYAFTQNLSRAITVAERLDTGMVGINSGVVSNPAAPFGGVKASGFGREGGSEGISEYLETKYVGITP